MDDNLIIDMFWRRSEDALAECAVRFGAYCGTIAMNILHDSGDAEECVNETWLNAWNAIPPARPAILRAFLGKITRNIAINRYNSKHTQKRGGAVELAIDELSDIPAPQTKDSGEITRVINAFLRSETERNADIFIKRYWYLHSVKEISAQYGYSENRLTALLFRMRARLKTKLEIEGLM